MKPMFISALIMMIFSFLTLILQRKHILMSLLALESIMLTLVYSMMLLSCMQFNTHLLPLILTFGASEASIGLALLVVLTRSYGSDTVNIMSLSKC
uniref:NADH-ubiquinone oxidoreductase chain 4L n=1 Tax=Thelepus plagiostoma TaxID=1084972 RepID=A0A8B6QMF7_9ANNE|nr:NADH dehydrogenase subunit 4L [Thelepus plagiostoma]QTJ29900.1 NADH dehydrogenase subunit 4L [Thelepus plagiostoma]